MTADTDRAEPDRAAPPVSRRASWIALGVALTLAALFVVLAVAKPNEGEGSGARPMDVAAPKLVTSTLDGAVFDLSQLRGQWTVLNFFNTTCIPCQAEHQALLDFVAQQSSLGADGARLYTVVYDRDTPANVRAWFAARGGNWPVLMDADGRAAVGFGVTGVPETWVVDPNGRTRLRYIGAVATGTELSMLVQELREGRTS